MQRESRGARCHGRDNGTGASLRRIPGGLPSITLRHDGAVEETIGEILATSRRRMVRGRDVEVRSLVAAVEDSDVVLVHVHGPGGVGKSTVLDQLADRLAERGRPVVRVDCADLDPTVTGFRDGVEAAATRQCTDLGPGAVLMIDRFDAIEALASWFWKQFLVALPSGTSVVVAGRSSPYPSWTSDPAFTFCARTLALRNLEHVAAVEVLQCRGVTDPLEASRLARTAYGHPLALTIMADAHRTGSRSASSVSVHDHPDVTARLLGAFLDERVTSIERRALHICGHTRRVDRGMLCHVLEVDQVTGDALLDWLRARPYAEVHPDGITVHDLVRDALEHDLRWRDRDAFDGLHSRIREQILKRMTDGPPADFFRHAVDLMYLHRANPRARGIYSFATMGSSTARPLLSGLPEERAWAIESFAIERRCREAAFWIEHQPERWLVCEDAWGRRAGLMVAARADLLPDAAVHDAVLAWAVAAVSRIRPVEPGEAVLHQMALDVIEPGRIGVVSDQSAMAAIREWATPGLGWVFASSALEDRWSALWEYAGLERLGFCTVDGGDVGVWARDFTRSGYSDWLTRMGAQELDDRGLVRPPVAAPIALSRADFADAVHRLLKELATPENIRTNPLRQARLVADDADPVAALARLLRRAVAAVSATPGSEAPGAALERTYLRRQGSHQSNAAALHVSHSTYRRHLAAGVDRLVDLLWEWELHGIPDHARD